MSNLFIAGVGNVDLFKGNQSVLVSKTLVDSSINLSVSLEDVKAGAGAKLYGRYAHSSGMTMKLTDAMFRMEFLAANIGADVQLGGEAVAMVSATVTGGKITLPTDIEKLYPEMEKALVWVAEANGKNEFIPFEIADGVTEITGLPWADNTTVCIRYIKPHEAGQTLKVSANFIPDTLTAVLTAPLFAGDQNNMESSTRVGTLTITIPRFMLNGTTDLSMSMTGVAQTELEGTALAVEDETCDGDGYYAIISKVLMIGNWYDDLIDLKIENGNNLESGEKLIVYGRFGGFGYSTLDEDKYNIIYDEDVIEYENGFLFNLTKSNQNFEVKIVGNTDKKVVGILLPSNLSDEELEKLKYYGDYTIEPTNIDFFTYETNTDDTVSITGYSTPSNGTSTLVEKIYGATNSNNVVIVPYKIEDKLVTSIGDSVFKECDNLTKIVIPNTVITLGNSVFYDCTALANLHMSKNITAIGESAFYACTNLTSLELPKGITTIEKMTFEGCTGLTAISIPDSVVSIGIESFAYCSSLKNIQLPSSINIIGESAFYNCISFENITIPNNVTEIGRAAFYECTSLKHINIPNSVSVIGEHAFQGCTALTEINIPNSVTVLERYIVSGCSALKTVLLPNNLITIRDAAFYQCSSLESIDIPESVTTIEKVAFRECSSLTNINLSNNIIELGQGAFYKCSELKEINISDKITEMISYTFAHCYSLTSIIIPNSVTIINASAFANCNNLTSILIPESVTNIAGDAFYNCTSLTIHCKQGSYAETYATENNIPYVTDIVD